jgi:3-oxoacyl-[acyl-carrier-protein] synthase III
MGVSVTGWGVALPQTELTNADLAASLDVTEDWIEERTGIRSRRVARNGETSGSLAVEACTTALANAGTAAGDIDTVIVATSTPDHQLPAVAPQVQSALGAKGAAFDIGAGCSGFLYALAQADALVRAEVAGSVLVCGADVISRLIDYTDPKTAILFGDGAGAAVVRHDETDRLGPFALHSDGSDPALLRVPPGQPFLEMNGREVYKRAVDEMTRSVREILSMSGHSIEEIDLLVAHQANARILKAVGTRLGIPLERVALNIGHLGNTSAASIPLAVHEAMAEGRLRLGDRVVLTAFGAGFVWGAGLLSWGIEAAATDIQPELEAIRV